MSSILPPATYVRYAEELCRYGCGYDAFGRTENDAVYQAVTEGRDRGAAQRNYSSCGDLAHWMLYRLGLRCQWVNREENLGWVGGDLYNNITLLQRCPEIVRTPPHDALLACGDVGVVWNTGYDAHVFVALGPVSKGRLLVAEYGQPGGKVQERAVTRSGKLMKVGGRTLNRLLPLEAAIEGAESRGELAPPEHARAWAHRLSLVPPDPSASDTDPRPPMEAIAPPVDPDSLPVLRIGATGEYVRLLQGRLAAKGWSVKVDGVFGPETQRMVREFQHRYWRPDGVVGRLTWGKLLED